MASRRLVSVLGVTADFDPAAARRRSALFPLSAGSFTRSSGRRLIFSLAVTPEARLLFLSPSAPLLPGESAPRDLPSVSLPPVAADWTHLVWIRSIKSDFAYFSVST